MVVTPSSERCFPETGFCISGRIRAYWEHHGGLPVLGFPITPLRAEDAEGSTVQAQWFERARFEDHVEQSSGASQVLLGLLGNELLGRTTPRYLWPGAAPAGLVIQPHDTRADNSGFVIVLTQPGELRFSADVQATFGLH
jgi:hypothetical protein